MTYIRVRHGWRYLVAISDWDRRDVVGWTRGVQISMDGPGRATETILTKRLWGARTCKEVDVADDAHPRAARQGIGDAISFYNTQRPQQALDDQRPREICNGYISRRGRKCC